MDACDYHVHEILPRGEVIVTTDTGPVKVAGGPLRNDLPSVHCVYEKHG